MFRLERLARDSSQVQIRLTTIPASAVISTSPPVTFGGEISRSTASYASQTDSSSNVMPLACAERISARLSP